MAATQDETLDVAREPPGSWGYPIIGSTRAVWNDFVGFVRSAMGNEANAHPSPGRFARACPVFKASVMREAVAFTTTHATRAEICSAARAGDFGHHGGYYKLLHDTMGSSIVTSDNSRYIHIVRSLFEPVFGEAAVRTCTPLARRIAREHMATWSDKSTCATGVPLYASMKKMYAEMILRTFVGDDEIKSGAADTSLPALVKDTGLIFTGATSLPVSSTPLFTTSYSKGKAASVRVNAMYQRLLLRHMAELRAAKAKPGQTCQKSECLVRLVAQRMLQMTEKHGGDPAKGAGGPHRTLLSLAAAHLTLFTTGLTYKLLASLTVSFARVMASQRHQDTRRRINAEVRSLVETLKPTRGRLRPPPFHLAVSRLACLESVCLEIERLFPPLAGLSRGATSDTGLAGYKIKKDWMVWACHELANTDPSVFTKPHQFDPSRWARGEGTAAKETGDDAKSRKDSKTETCGPVGAEKHLAFGFGPRACLGARFSIALWKTVCVELTAGYRWSLEQPRAADRGVLGGGSGGPRHGQDAWRVKWIPVYRPDPDVMIRLRPHHAETQSTDTRKP